MAKRRPTQIRSVQDCEPDRANANRHTARGTALMEASIREYGYGDSMTVDKHGRIISGNQRAETLSDLGMNDAIVVQSDGTKPIIHQRTDLNLDTDPRAKGLALAQNRVGQVNLDWDVAALKSFEADGVDLSNFWHTDELFTLLQSAIVDEVVAPVLPNDNAHDFEQMTFTLHRDQAVTVREAIAKAKGADRGTSPPNENSNGNALAAICEAYRG